MGSGIGVALVSLAWILIRVSDGAAISKRVVNSVLRIMDIATCAGYLCGISYFMDISSLSGISIIDIRYRYWYHLYQLSGYMYIYMYIYRASVWVSPRSLIGIGIGMASVSLAWCMVLRQGTDTAETSILVEAPTFVARRYHRCTNRRTMHYE